MALEDKHGAHNYHPMPVVLARGKGVHVWDTDGKEYLDFLSAYSAIISALTEQAQTLTLTSRAFHNDILGPYSRFITEYFEGGETAVKLIKGVPSNEAKVVFCNNNFWGQSYTNYGPFVPGFEQIPYNDLNALKVAVSDPNCAAFMVEPIQGEAGVVVPDEGFMRQAKDICSQHNVLLIADEVQTGLARTGKLLACDHDQVKPDILVLGKALSGGILPVMLTIRPGQHGSTFGGNPLACKVATAALEVIRDENLAENAEIIRGIREVQKVGGDSSPIEIVRGKGLLNAIIITPKNNRTAMDFCMDMKDLGVLAKPTHEHIIRLAPPLCINEHQIDQVVNIIGRCAAQF
eukprot:GSMAST32.ASY1.ANO1.2403.1 assembled CDS